MGKFETHFISQNKLPGDGYIGVYNGTKLVGKVKANNLKIPELGKKLYSFGALSDVHVSSETARSHFENALKYLNEVEKVSFTCIAGDLTNEGNESKSQFTNYGQYVKEYSATPVYEVTGNHELQSSIGTTEEPFVAPLDFLKEYTGHLLYYTVSNKPTDEEETYNYYSEAVGENDVFIMFGMSGWWSYTKSETFSVASLDWLYKTLEANRNKRCFLFTHPPRFDGSGKPYAPIPTGDLIDNTVGRAFKNLTEHYKNVIYFHGHTHMSFECQKDVSYANYDRLYGCHSVHIPSLMSVKTLNSTEDGYDVNAAKGMGYVVDVYENHIILRGRDFVSEKFVPIATYCLDTTLQYIEANTFTDSTGAITT